MSNETTRCSVAYLTSRQAFISLYKANIKHTLSCWVEACSPPITNFRIKESLLYPEISCRLTTTQFTERLRLAWKAALKNYFFSPSTSFWQIQRREWKVAKLGRFAFATEKPRRRSIRKSRLQNVLCFAKLFLHVFYRFCSFLRWISDKSVTTSGVFLWMSREQNGLTLNETHNFSIFELTFCHVADRTVPLLVRLLVLAFKIQ